MKFPGSKLVYIAWRSTAHSPLCIHHIPWLAKCMAGQHHQFGVAGSAERSQMFGVTFLEYPEINVLVRPVSGS